MPDSDLERRLVRAGVELLAEAGTDAVSLREIARRAGVSHGAPRRYFPTHQALLAAIALEGYRDLAALVEESLGGGEGKSEAGGETRATKGEADGDARAAKAEAASDVREAVLALGRRYLAFARAQPGMFALMFRHDLLTGNNIGLRGTTTPIFGVLVKKLEHASVADPAVTAAALWAALHGIAQLSVWGTLPVVTGVADPDPLLTATVDAHLER